MGPGGKTPRRMNGDTREWWIVQSGTLRFTVEGREPVVATKGVMVQVPYRTLYQIENVGTEPALRFEVNVDARAQAVSARRDAGAGGRLRLRPDARDRRARHARCTEPAGGRLQQGRGRRGTRRGVRQRRPQLREHHHRAAIRRRSPATRATTTRKAPSSGSSCSARSATTSKALPEFEAEAGRRRVRAAADVAPGELRRPRGAALVPSRDERLPVSGAHVRAQVMRRRHSRARWAGLIAVAVAAIASLAAGQGTDPLAGTWVLNVAQSKFPGPPPLRQTTILEVVDGGLHREGRTCQRRRLDDPLGADGRIRRPRLPGHRRSFSRHGRPITRRAGHGEHRQQEGWDGRQPDADCRRARRPDPRQRRHRSLGDDHGGVAIRSSLITPVRLSRSGSATRPADRGRGVRHRGTFHTAGIVVGSHAGGPTHGVGLRMKRAGISRSHRHDSVPTTGTPHASGRRKAGRP